MKKQYEKPIAKKVTFDFEQVLAQSSCGSGIVITQEPNPCTNMITPDKSIDFGVSTGYSWKPNPNICGWQSAPNK